MPIDHNSDPKYFGGIPYCCFRAMGFHNDFIMMSVNHTQSALIRTDKIDRVFIFVASNRALRLSSNIIRKTCDFYQHCIDLAVHGKYTANLIYDFCNYETSSELVAPLRVNEIDKHDEICAVNK